MGAVPKSCGFGTDLLTCDRGYSVKEFLDAVPSFEVVDEIPERDACALEHRRAAKNIRITVDGR